MERHLRRALGAAVILCMLLNSSSKAAATVIHAGERLTLERAIQIALKMHPLRLEAQAEAGAAQQRIGEAQSAMLPQVYGSAQYLRSTDNGIGDTSYLNPGFIPRISGTDHNAPTDTGQTFSSGNNYLAGIGASQYLFDFGRVRGFIAQRRDEAAVAHANVEMTDLHLIFKVTRSYFALLAAHQIVNVYQRAVAERQEQLHAAQVRANAGLTSEIDVYTAQATLARARVHLLDAQNELANGKAALDNAIGLGPEAPDYKLAGAFTYKSVAGSLEQDFNKALEMRPDMLMIENEALAEGAKIVQYRSEYFPTVDATAGYNAMGTGTPAANNYDVGIVITWPLFNGFLTTHQVDEAKLRQHALAEALEDLRQRIYLEVKSALLDQQTAHQRIRQAELTMEVSKAELNLASKRYTTGLGNIIELTDAERFYVQDDAAYVDALYKYSVAEATVGRATGELLAQR